MEILHSLLFGESAAHSVLLISLVVTLGLSFGEIKFFGIRLGVAGVLFAGILFGHFKIQLNPEILEFARELGLILFVYTIGMQVGPSFLSSFKKEGLRLNLMAASIVLMGAVITLLLAFFANVPLPAAVGMFSGATTNTPSLAAAQQVLKDMPNIPAEVSKMPGVGYALAYPFGILGIILTMLVTRKIFHLNPAEEAKVYGQTRRKELPPLEVSNLIVQNNNLAGKSLSAISDFKSSFVTVSRIMHDGVVQVAFPETKLALGDVILAVGPAQELERLQLLVGAKAGQDLRDVESNIISKRVIVSRPEVAGKDLEELDTFHRYGVKVTRIMRMEEEMQAHGNVELQLGDRLMVVGDEKSLKKFMSEMGDSFKQLDRPHVVPIFIGIALGVLLGSIPLNLPNVPVPVKLGLAGGPLLVAIFLSSRKVGHWIWYMPSSSNYLLREFGISMFLACVGLKAGDQFVETLLHGQGFYWMACATLITVVPILIVALIAKMRYHMNYLTLCGLLSGSMTDPPALAFANQMASSNAQMVSYASVYPLVMLLRIFCAQALVIFFL